MNKTRTANNLYMAGGGFSINFKKPQMLDNKFDKKLIQITEEINGVSNNTIKLKLLDCKTKLQYLFEFYKIHLSQVKPSLESIADTINILSAKNKKTTELINKLSKEDETEKIIYKSQIRSFSSIISVGKLNISSLLLSKTIIEVILESYVINLDKKTFQPEILKAIVTHLLNILMSKITVVNASDAKIIVNSSLNNYIKSQNKTVDQQLNYYDNLLANIDYIALLIKSEMETNYKLSANFLDIYYKFLIIKSP